MFFTNEDGAIETVMPNNFSINNNIEVEDVNISSPGM